MDGLVVKGRASEGGKVVGHVARATLLWIPGWILVVLSTILKIQMSHFDVSVTEYAGEAVRFLAFAMFGFRGQLVCRKLSFHSSSEYCCMLAKVFRLALVILTVLFVFAAVINSLTASFLLDQAFFSVDIRSGHLFRRIQDFL